jgi:hypothetical protein
MEITPIITQSITTTVQAQNNRVQTTRREYTENMGRVEVKETSWSYTVYDNKGQVAEPLAANQVDLRV